MTKSLQLKKVSKFFGGIIALDNVSIEFVPGKIYCLIGPNGAGKTTLFNVITGFEKVDSGEIFYGDQRISNMSISDIAYLRIRRTFQEVRNIWDLKSNENIILGSIERNDLRYNKILFYIFYSKRNLKCMIQESEKTLNKYGFGHIAHSIVSQMSYGEMKIVEMLRSINSKPDILLFDEPISGLTNELVNEVTNIIVRLSEEGITVVIIEHNYQPIFEIADSVILMSEGKIVIEDNPEIVATHPEAKRIYIDNVNS